MMTSYAISVKNTLKVSLAPKALSSTIHGNVWVVAKRKNFGLRLSKRPQIGDFYVVMVSLLHWVGLIVLLASSRRKPATPADSICPSFYCGSLANKPNVQRLQRQSSPVVQWLLSWARSPQVQSSNPLVDAFVAKWYCDHVTLNTRTWSSVFTK